METQEISRNKAQVQAMFALYDVLTYLDMGEDVDVEGIISGLSGACYEQSSVYVKETVIQSIKHYEEIVLALNKHMRGWTFARLNRVEEAILLLSYVHFFYLDDKIDKSIVINVAVKLAKSYLDAKDYRFVNALLDKVLIRE